MVFSLHVCLYIMCVPGTCRRPEVGIIPGIGVTGSCEQLDELDVGTRF